MLNYRLATQNDIPRALEICASARRFMVSRNNPTQWAGGYPNEEVLMKDISLGTLYCVFDDSDLNHICGIFALIPGIEPTYNEIFEGAWLDNETPYLTIHRIASDGSHPGIFDLAMKLACEKGGHVRIDTHKDNLPKQKCIARWDFEYCGIIYIADGTPRIAFERLAPKQDQA